ncbi:hypothetical protein ACH35V_16790 [Actinomadura sp. 1N219]|uniref:hypothetical protein n=1 Tax=Actinomadura sp. 1N219 TaxID=3375152 RepID=UPI0037BB4D84
MNALIAAKWFSFGGLCLVAGCLAWLRMLNLLTGRYARGVPRWLAALAVVPLTLPGMAGLWFGLGTLAD